MSRRPYGSWPSPVSAERCAAGGVRLGHLTTDGGWAYWLERRPDEDGRGRVVRSRGGSTETVSPPGVDVKTLVHEYGGGDFAVHDDVLYFSAYGDQRLYRQPVGEDPVPITPEPERERADRYADATVTPDGSALYCVRERHHEAGEPTNALVRAPTDGSADPEVVFSGTDFVSSPRVSPCGAHLAWLAWDHPAMPWDETTLHRATIDPAGTLSAPEAVLGAAGGESVVCPRWSPDGTLHAVSDRTGWWTLYRVGDEPIALCEREAEFGVPAWVFGLSTYAFLPDGRIATVVHDDGIARLALLESGGDLSFPDLPYTAYRPAVLNESDGALWFVAGATDRPPSVVRWVPDGGFETVARSFEFEWEGYVPDHEPIAVDSDGTTVYAHLYPPTNPEFEGEEGERPPLVTTVHGGPTSESPAQLDLEVAFFTSRGVTVADVNYRGSTGYGRRYREALSGEWGVVDTNDCVTVARYLAEAGRVDPDRLAIRGGSAGGYAVLCALAFHDAFAAGTSYYGVADLRSLAAATHKFESRYLDGLVGPLPEAGELYDERSPVNAAHGIDAPTLLLQGTDDPVVPQGQTEAMARALSEAGTDHAVVLFEGERHGFRRSASIERALSTELAFYRTVFGIDSAEETVSLPLSTEPEPVVVPR